MKKLLFLLIFLPGILKAEGPLYRQKDSTAQLEFENSYQDIRKINGTIGYNSNGYVCVKSSAICASSSNVVTMNGNQIYPLTQLIYGTLNVRFATTSNVYQATGLKATIIPKSTTSQIKISLSSTLRSSNPNASAALLTIKRNSTDLGTTTGVAAINGTSVTRVESPLGVIIIDSPATTSSVTYEAYLLSTDGVTSVALNDSQVASFITLEEIIR